GQSLGREAGGFSASHRGYPAVRQQVTPGAVSADRFARSPCGRCKEALSEIRNFQTLGTPGPVEMEWATFDRRASMKSAYALFIEAFLIRRWAISFPRGLNLPQTD